MCFLQLFILTRKFEAVGGDTLAEDAAGLFLSVGLMHIPQLEKRNTKFVDQNGDWHNGQLDL